eukprot:CAMPEP_0177652490 /NCGR_PEP_ID=MMETSP0447-20121125/13164_1 /TAXON_ID=0 /ORGANISM="Stygamoeba regulata, Strain BSH-02190019" /LENGTH=134 /DNA_ID=CAMNT_0019155751 /DNA_START=592 /DNA_END=994 /DNA_ORIENTATION=-
MNVQAGQVGSQQVHAEILRGGARAAHALVSDNIACLLRKLLGVKVLQFIRRAVVRCIFQRAHDGLVGQDIVDVLQGGRRLGVVRVGGLQGPRGHKGLLRKKMGGVRLVACRRCRGREGGGGGEGGQQQQQQQGG